MAELKELIGEELATQVEAKLGGKKLLVDDGSFIPEYRFKEKTSEVKELKDRLAEQATALASLSAVAGEKEALTKQISALEVKFAADSAAAEATSARLAKSLAVKEFLMDSGVADADARDLLSLKFDLEKVELDENGKPKGLDDVLKPLKENQSFKGMFGTAKMRGQQHQEGSVDLTLGEHATNNPFSKKTLNITKQIELKRTNPALAQRLLEIATT